MRDIPNSAGSLRERDARPAIPYSVVTPVYNAARTLGQTIDAVLRLDPPPSAVYIIDDASTDGSPDIARRYQAVTTEVLEVNQGPGHARNVGARMARTELLLMIDSDCYIEPQGFRAAYDRLALNPQIAGIMGVPVRETPGGPFAGMFKNYWYHLEFEAWGNPPRTLYGSCFLMRRDAYLSVGGFDESFGRTHCEDAEFYFRLVQARHVFERRMDFAFVHDKTMTLRQLVRTSFGRSVSIIQNMRGKRGRAGNPWRPVEKLVWAMEIGAGTAAAAGTPVVIAAAASLAFAGDGGAALAAARALTAAWLLSLLVFFLCIYSKLAFSVKDKGVIFAAKAFFCRMLEMPAVALGIVWGSISRPRAIQEDKA